MPRATRAKALALLVAVVSVTALHGPAPAVSAPDEPQRSWSSSVETICVASRVGPEWGVKAAVRQWNRVPGGPTFVLEADCPDHEGAVTVRYRSSADRFTGWTEWFWDGSGHLVHADITLNPQRIRAFDRADRPCMRRHTTSHELGHALGLRHYPRTNSGSVMSYLGWRQRCGRPSAHDRSDFRALYPVAPDGA
jgi:hypothetical protein